MAFLPRHGRGHRYLPGGVPYRANIFALKRLGVRWIIAVSACGSMREEIAPLDVVIPDQLFDRTRTRPSTFFDQEGAVVHTGFADPFCPVLGDALQGAGAQAGPGYTGAGPTSASRAPSSPPGPNRASTASGGWT